MSQTVLLIALIMGLVGVSQPYEIVSAGHLPAPIAHGSAIYDDDDSVFILGGGNEEMTPNVIRYNLTSMEATIEESKFPYPMSQGAVGSDGKGNMFHLGGARPGYVNIPLKDIYSFTSTNPELVLVGNLTEPCYIHNAASDGQGSIYVSGVTRYNGAKEILRFDTTTFEVEVAGNYPVPLRSSITAWAGDSLYSFGGVVDEQYSSERIFKFTPSTSESVELNVKLEGGQNSASAVSDGKHIYIVGGHQQPGPGFYLNKFDPETEKFEELEVTNFFTQLTSPHATCIAKTNRIYVFGGSSFAHGARSDVFYIQL